MFSDIYFMKKMEFLERARDRHGYKYKYVGLPDKITLKDKVNMEFDGTVYVQTVSKHLSGRCPEKKTDRMTTEDFVEKSKFVWGNKYDYSIVEYKGSLDTVKIIYDGIVYEQRASSHLGGMAPEFRKNEESVVKDLIRKSECDIRSEIESFLTKHGVNYIKRWVVDGIDFEFYLVDLRIAVEYFGLHHYQPVEELGGISTYENIMKSDKSKSNYCEDNYIDLIKIRYDQTDDIPGILWESLKNWISKSGCGF